MGLCQSCCPWFTSPDDSTVEGGYSGVSNVHVSTHDTAPLMSNDVTASASYNVNAKGASVEGLENAGSLPGTASLAVGNVVNAEQHAFARILQESANQMIDCTAIGPLNTAISDSKESHNAMEEAAAIAANEKAALYGRRLAAAANALIAKHLDVHEDLGEALKEEKLYMEENVLDEREENAVLATEVALKASETLDNGNSLTVPDQLVVHFSSNEKSNEEEHENNNPYY